jgi:hypothetical protein
MRRVTARLVGREDGQTTSEYLVITGMVGTLAVAMVNALYGPVQQGLQRVAQLILSAVTGPP